MKKYQNLILYFFICLFAIIYTVQVVVNHYYFRTYALDYGFYNQAFWDFAHFRANHNTVFGHQLNYFQVHPGFTLLLISPLYHLFNPIFGTYSLLIIQNIFIMIGGYCVYLLIYNKTGNFWIGILAFIHFNLIWGHYSALASDFIEATIGASMVPVFLLFFEKRRFTIAGLIFLFILACKENMPIWFIFISLVLFLTYKDKKPKIIALAFAIFSILYLVFLFKVVIPYFEEPGKPYWGFAYSVLGNNMAEAAMFLISHPIEGVRLLFLNHLNDPGYDEIKKEFYIVFLLSGGVLLFRRPVYILAFIPVIAQKMYNDYFIRWGICGFYSIEIVSILSVYAFLATISLKSTIFRYTLYGILCISTLLMTLNKMDHRHSLWYDAQKEDLVKYDFYKSNMDVKKIRKQIREIVPDQSPLVATQNVVPHFSQRRKVSIFPHVNDAVYLVLLKETNTYPITPKAFDQEMNKFLNDPDWMVILNEHPLLILKKRHPNL